METVQQNGPFALCSSNFHSNIYSILFVPIIAKPGMSSFHFDRCINDITEKMKLLFKKIIFEWKKSEIKIVFKN